MWKQKAQDQTELGNISPCAMQQYLRVGFMLAQLALFGLGFEPILLGIGIGRLLGNPMTSKLAKLKNPKSVRTFTTKISECFQTRPFPPSSNRKSTHTFLNYLTSHLHLYFQNSCHFLSYLYSNPILTYRVEKIRCHLSVYLKCSVHHRPAIVLPTWSSFQGKTENQLTTDFTAKTCIEGTFVSCCNKLLPPTWFNTTDTYSLIFLEAKTMKSRCQQRGFL